MKRLARSIASGDVIVHTQDKKGNLHKVQFVHFLNFRDIPVKQKISPCKLLFGNILPDLEENSLQYGFQWVKKNQEKVIFFFDGLDQVTWSLMGNHNKVNYTDETSTATIMYNILTGHLFGGIRIIMSSREHAICPLMGHLRPDTVAALTGLALNDVKQLFIQLAGKEGEQLWHELCTNAPTLIPLCSIPLFLIFVVIVFKSNSTTPHQTMTGIMTTILQIFMRSKNVQDKERIRDILNQLKKLSFKGINSGKVIFSLDDLKIFDLDPKILHDFVILVPGSNILSKHLMEREYRLFFCHQSIQEFLSALAIAEMSSEKFRVFVSESLNKPHWSVVRRLLCGILLNQGLKKDDLKEILSADKAEKKRSILISHLKLQEKDLEWFACLHESNDRELIQSTVDGVELRWSVLTPNDAYVISSVIHHCLPLNFIVLDGCSLTPEILGIIQKASSNTKIEELSVSCNKEMGIVGFAALGQIVKSSEVQNLNLSYCNIKPQEIASFQQSLGDAKMKGLSVSCNEEMGIMGFATLGQIVKSSEVQSLKMTACDIKPQEIESFQQSLGDAKMKELIASRNEELGMVGFAALGQIVKSSEIQSLDLSLCNIRPQEIRSFQQSLGDAKMKKLELASNDNIGSDGARVIAELIRGDQVKEVIMFGCCLNAVDKKMLKKTARANHVKIDVQY